VSEPERSPATTTPPAPSPRRWRRRALVGLGGALALALGLQLLLCGWAVATSEPLDPGYVGPRPLPADVLARFDYPERGTPPEVFAEFNPSSGSGWTSRWVQVLVTTPGDTEQHKVQIIHLRPTGLAGRRAPAVVITPILGGSYGLEQVMGAALARRGLHAAIVLRAESLLGDGTEDETRLERVTRTAVIDRRRAIDWLEAQPDVGAIGALGASQGGITTVGLAAIDSRVQAAVVLLAGGDLGQVLSTSDEPRVVRWREARLARVGGDVDALAARVRAAVTSDPLALAPHVDARRVLFGLTRLDDDVPYAAQLRLCDALGQPERFTLPTGHASAALALPYLVSRATGFLEDRLRAPLAPN
jgi:dienelactone hydrolase